MIDFARSRASSSGAVHRTSTRRLVTPADVAWVRREVERRGLSWSATRLSSALAAPGPARRPAGASAACVPRAQPRDCCRARQHFDGRLLGMGLSHRTWGRSLEGPPGICWFPSPRGRVTSDSPRPRAVPPVESNLVIDLATLGRMLAEIDSPRVGACLDSTVSMAVAAATASTSTSLLSARLCPTSPQ